MVLQTELCELLESARTRPGPVVVLTGAGVSAESGIPTFRGPEGYWRVGSRHWFPEELATMHAFRAMPETVWSWYLHRRAVCGRAAPNAAHRALAALEHALEDRFLLITQNVDGLHLRAGNSPEHTYQIHGNLDFVRCAAECCPDVLPFPRTVACERAPAAALSPRESEALHCPSCGAWLRPHVLWFDECYDEVHFRFESSMRAAGAACLLLVAGTSGSTNLPAQICAGAARAGAPLVVVNRDPSPFSEVALREGGYFVQGAAGTWIPRIVERLASPPRRSADPTP